MNLAEFQKLRNGLQMNAAPVTSQVRAVLEVGLQEELAASGLFENIEVGSSDDPDRLVIALCVFRAEISDAEVALAVERAWSALAFHHWSAHTFISDDGHVELQAACLDRPGGRFVSVHLVAQRAAVPAQPATPERELAPAA